MFSCRIWDADVRSQSTRVLGDCLLVSRALDGLSHAEALEDSFQPFEQAQRRTGSAGPASRPDTKLQACHIHAPMRDHM